ncbi:hypothetical protein BDD12DRAFT_882775 [Trichophaea hybrida]|nr:hypothetical protein BDD12DRAFT_882775 [Trichophaea hybrida]
MSLLTLPNELLHFVGDNLDDPRDLNSFLRTSHLLYSLFNRTLYRVHSGGDAVLEAICCDDAPKLERFLDYGLHIETICPMYFFQAQPLPLLGTAAVTGNKNVVHMLIARGAATDTYPLLNLVMESRSDPDRPVDSYPDGASPTQLGADP